MDKPSAKYDPATTIGLLPLTNVPRRKLRTEPILNLSFKPISSEDTIKASEAFICDFFTWIHRFL